MHINFALIAAITTIIQCSVALPLARPSPQARQLEKRGSLPSWVAVALTVVIFHNRSKIFSNDDKVEKLQQRIEELLEDDDVNQPRERQFQSGSAFGGSVKIDGGEGVTEEGNTVAVVPSEGDDEEGGVIKVKTDNDWWLGLEEA